MIVAGGGIVGLSCAWRLAQNGVRVTLFDARETGAEASWAGVGMLSPGGEVTGDSRLARMAIASLAQYDAFVEELQDVSGLPIDYSRPGGLELAFTGEEVQALEERALRQSTIGIRSEAAGPGRRFYPDDALVDPRDVTAALRIACLRTGVDIREHTPLRQLPAGERVLIAAGAWSTGLCPPSAPRSIPVRGHLIAFDATSIRLPSILRHGHTYVVQRARTGRIIAGSSTEHAGFDRAIDQEIIREIHARAAGLVPELASLVPSAQWNGFRPGLENGVPGPVVGRFGNTRVWAAYGHYRNGILLAPETARIIAADITQNLG